MAGVFGQKHLTALVDQAKLRHQIARSHVPQPSYRAREFLNRLIKPEHRDVLRQAEEVVGALQSHTYIQFRIKTKEGKLRNMSLHFKQTEKLLPKYVAHNELPDDPYFAPVHEWFERRMEWRNKFTEVISTLRYLDSNAGSLATMKLYFHGITALMEKVEGLEKRTDNSRELRVPMRLPAIPPVWRQAGIRATQTLSLASLYTEVQEQPTTHLTCVDDEIY